ncbi:MAG: hypothetical protein ACR2NN_02835 [Bryobacteraceae bacterium]
MWEPVLVTDFGEPSSAALQRIIDSRTAQFWDKGRLISHEMGEHDRKSVVWDHIAVYPPGAVWDQAPPPALFEDGPVVQVIDRTRQAIAKALPP